MRMILSCLFMFLFFGFKVSDFTHDKVVADFFSVNRSTFSGYEVRESTSLGDIFVIGNSQFLKRDRDEAYIWNELGQIFPLNDLQRGFWLGSLEFLKDDISPAVPNCDEKKFRIGDLLKIIKRKDVNSTLDVLNALPKGTLQKFTFIHDSNSLQSDATMESPRVLRFNTDGTLSLTYTIDSKQKSFNTIEAIAFDEIERKYNFYHFSFKRNNKYSTIEDYITNRVSKRININHPTCLGCHGGLDPRPNWNQYHSWPGVFGRDDDFFKFYEDSFVKDYEGDWSRNNDGANYKKFRRITKFNPHISSLPWPDETSSSYDIYPYTQVKKLHNYNFRPNAHYTIVQSRRNAQRIARKFEQSKNWDYIKYFVGMNAINCDEIYDHSFESLVESIGPSVEGRPYLLPDQFLRNLGKYNNFFASDWNLHFYKGGGSNKKQSYHTSQWSMENFVYSVLYQDLTDEIPELKESSFRVNRMSNLFGKKFQCVDQIADKIMLDQFSKIKVCHTLKRKQIEILNNFENPFLKVEKKKTTTKYIQSRKSGREIVSQSCVMCHNGDVLKYDFSDDKTIKMQLRFYRKKYLNLIDKKLGNQKKCDMPYSMAGPCLDKKDKTSVLNYFKKLLIEVSKD